MAKRVVVAIDGPAGAGKSTIARRVAARLGFVYIDTGAMYRAVALLALRAGVDLSDAARLEPLAREARIEFEPGGSRTLLDGEDVSEAIRAPEMSQAASRVSVLSGVRRALVEKQRQMGAARSVVMEGRDIGSVVFPNAEVKIYLDADSPFSKFSPRFSSDPPRADADILAMIGAPLVNRAETQGIGLTAGLVYSDLLGHNWILRPFEQKVRQVLNLDLFSVRTQIVQNLVAQKVLGTTLNPLDNTSVSLGKYLGNDLFLEMLVSLQQPLAPVALVAPGGGLIAASTALQPDLELSLEWATPFFLLDWTFEPQHPETMFLSDNSISFSWRITY